MLTIVYLADHVWFRVRVVDKVQGLRGLKISFIDGNYNFHQENTEYLLPNFKFVCSTGNSATENWYLNLLSHFVHKVYMLHWPDLHATGAVVKVVAGTIQMAQFFLYKH